MEKIKLMRGGHILQAPQAGEPVFYRVVRQRFPTVGAEICSVLVRSAAVCAKHRCLLEYSVSLTYGLNPFDLPVAVFSLQGNVQNGSSVMGFPAHFLGGRDHPLQSDVGRIP